MKANVEFLRENFGMNDTIFEECRLAGALIFSCRAAVKSVSACRNSRAAQGETFLT